MTHRTLLPLALLAGACTTPTATPVDQAEADAIAVDLIDTLVAEDAPFMLVRAGEVDEGAQVVEDDPTATEEDPAVEVEAPEPGFLFLLDLAPRAYFDHPVAWLLVGESGETITRPAAWRPRVDGQLPDTLIDDLEEDDEDVLASRFHLGLTEAVQPVWDLPLLDLQESNGYLVVQGLLPGESLHGDASLTGQTGRDFFEAYADAVSEVVYLADDEADETLDAIDELASVHDVVTVAIIAHGSVDGIGLGGVGFSAAQFRAAFDAHPDVTFNFLLGSCHGGSFVDDLADAPNVRAVLTAVDATQGATPDWDEYTGGPAVTDVNASDVGAEWFSSIYAAAGYLAGSNDRFADVRAAADDAGVPHSTALLCLAADGAIGDAPALDLDDDLDFSHFLGGHTPQRHCDVP